MKEQPTKPLKEIDQLVFTSDETQQVPVCPFCLNHWVESEGDYDEHMDGPNPCAGRNSVGKVVVDVYDHNLETRRAIVEDSDGDLWLIINNYSGDWMTLEPTNLDYALWYIDANVQDHEVMAGKWRRQAVKMGMWIKEKGSGQSDS